MSYDDKDIRDPGFQADPGYQTRLPGGGGVGSWIGAVVVFVLLLFAVGYVFGNRTTNGPGMIERRAAADAPAPASPGAPPPSPLSSPDAPAKP